MFGDRHHKDITIHSEEGTDVSTRFYGNPSNPVVVDDISVETNKVDQLAKKTRALTWIKTSTKKDYCFLVTTDVNMQV